MIDLEFLEKLIRAIDESSLDSIEIERGGTRVRLAKTSPAAPAPVAAPQLPAPTPASAPQASPGGKSGGPPAGGEEDGAGERNTSNLVDITSPMVGTFYRAPAPDAPPYVERGTRIAKGDTLCIIEAMKLMNELEAEIQGTVVEVLIENAEPVEYGQVLFRVEPA